ETWAATCGRTGSAAADRRGAAPDYWRSRMQQRYPTTLTRPAVSTSALATNSVLRNTYLLLGATLGFSALTAGIAMALNMPHLGLITLVGYFGLLFAVHKTQNSAWGLVWTFALTGFMGLTLGPILNAYLK